MEVEFDVQVDASALYDYMLYHTYHGAAGLLGTAAGALLVCCFFAGRGVLYLILGIVLLGYLPVSLFLKARAQAASTPAFRQPLHYKMSPEGVEVSQGEMRETTGWDGVYRAVSTNRSLILYTTRVNAFLFPRRALGEKQAAVIELISTHLPPARVRIRA